MGKIILILSFVLIPVFDGWSLDTLYTNPNYPPIVYSKSEYKFYKYTAKYIPTNMFHAFKILGSNDSHIIERFKRRSVASVINRGIFYPSARLRKEFCLEGYSDFVLYFHSRGIYYPRAMETYILLAFHQYLNQEKISWSNNKKLSLEGERKSNRQWRKRKRKLFKRKKVKVKEAKMKDKKKDTRDNPDELFWGEFE